MAFIILSRAPVTPLLAHSLGDVRMAIQTAIIGDTTKTYVILHLFLSSGGREAETVAVPRVQAISIMRTPSIQPA